MITWNKLRTMTKDELSGIGAEHTVSEIRQQPEMWRKTAAGLVERQKEVSRFFLSAGSSSHRPVMVIITGAGSSEFVGRAAAGFMQRGLGMPVVPIPTTDLTTLRGDLFIPGYEYILISCARSGDSPESLAAYKRVKHFIPELKHIVITCNAGGALSRMAEDDSNSIVIHLPPETNDRGLAMTSSFSSMLCACIGLAFLKDTAGYKSLIARASEAGSRLLTDEEDAISAAAETDVRRAAFLGSHEMQAVMQEGALKMLEMTGGKIPSVWNSFLGLRHGPQAFVDRKTLIAASLSSDHLLCRYEADLLEELRTKGQGAALLTIASGKLSSGPDTYRVRICNGKKDGLSPEVRLLTDICVCQILALLSSIKCGLKPDNPSPEGTINRVVQGVTIYS